MSEHIQIPCFNAKDTAIIKYIEANKHLGGDELQKGVLKILKDSYVKKAEPGGNGVSTS